MQSQTSSNRDIQPRWCRRRTAAPTKRRGAAAVEFAIVLPVLITILLGTTDFGRFAHSRIAIANAARSGAAYGSINPYNSSTEDAWKAGVAKSVTDELGQAAAFDPAKLTITTTHVTEYAGQRRVNVQVTYPFETLVNWPLFPSSFDLRQTVTMRGIR